MIKIQIASANQLGIAADYHNIFGDVTVSSYSIRVADLYLLSVEKKLTSSHPSNPALIDCPLCRGTGELSRNEILDRLGVKDFARVAQLSAEEAFRLLQSQYRQDGDALWTRFESELIRRVGEADQRHIAKVQELEARIRLSKEQSTLESQRVRAGETVSPAPATPAGNGAR